VNINVKIIFNFFSSCESDKEKKMYSTFFLFFVKVTRSKNIFISAWHLSFSQIIQINILYETHEIKKILLGIFTRRNLFFGPFK